MDFDLALKYTLVPSCQLLVSISLQVLVVVGSSSSSRIFIRPPSDMDPQKNSGLLEQMSFQFILKKH